MASNRVSRMRPVSVAAALLFVVLLITAPMVVGAQQTAGETQFERGLASFLEGKYEETVQLWLPLADAGDREAQYGIGMMHEMGRGVAPNAFQAARWYRRAAGQNHAAAQLSLGRLYASGRGVPQDLARAVAWYRRAADQGSPQAQYLLARSLLDGEGVDPDRAAGLQWLDRAVAADYQPADVLRRTIAAAPAEPETSDEGAGSKVEVPIVTRAEDGALSEPATSAREPQESEPDAGASSPATDEPSQEARAPDTEVAPDERDQIRRVERPGNFGVRVGTFQSNEAAVAAWKELSARHANLLDGLSARVSELSVGGRGATFYRLDVIPLTSEGEAVELCAELRRAGQYCFPVHG